MYSTLTSRRLAEQARRTQRTWIARAENILQIRERQAGVDDVLDDDDVLAVEGRIEILEEPDFTRAGRTARVAGQRHEVERHVSPHVPDEIRQKDEGTFQDGNQVNVIGEVAPNLGGQF